MLQGHEPGVIGGADDFIISAVGGWPTPRGYVVARQALRVTDGIELPGAERGTVYGALQNPVSRSRGIGRFDDDIGHLKDLKENTGWRGRGMVCVCLSPNQDLRHREVSSAWVASGKLGVGAGFQELGKGHGSSCVRCAFGASCSSGMIGTTL